MTILDRAARAAASADAASKANGFALWACASVEAARHKMKPAAVFEGMFPRSIHVPTVQAFAKAAVSAGTTTDTTWAAPLSVPPPFAAGFVEYVRGLSIVGQLQSAFRTVPVNVKVSRQTSAASVGWTGQGAPIMASSLAFDSLTLPPLKVAGIVALSRELIRLGTPDAVQLIRNDLAQAVAQFVDNQFFDPSLPGVANVSPAAITRSAVSIASTGSTGAQVTTDLAALLAAITTERRALFLIMAPRTALYLSKLRLATTDLPAFPDVNYAGGDVWGVPVIVSSNTPIEEGSPEQHVVVCIDASEILYADGGVELDTSEHAAIQLNSTPDNPPTASSVVTSLWQQNLSAVRVLRSLNWARAREGSVAVLTGVTY